jgi:hypothetical protein
MTSATCNLLHSSILYCNSLSDVNTCAYDCYSLVFDGESSYDDDIYSGEYLYQASLIGCDKTDVSRVHLYHESFLHYFFMF